MAKISICVEPVFGNLDYKSRIEKIASIGYTYYDLWFHNKAFDGANLTDEMKDFDMLAELNEKHGLITNSFVFCHPDGGIEASLIDKKDRQLAVDSLGEIIPLAKKVGCKFLVSGSGNVDSSISNEEAVESVIETLKAQAPECEKEGIVILLEPWNTKVDHPDCFLDDPQLGVDVVKAVASPSVKLLYDIYHMQIMAGNQTEFIKENLEHISAFQIAGVPGRHEPFNNELDYPFIIREVQKAGFDGTFGLEYWPTMDHEESLKKSLELLDV
jgi:hydroxypyruvate isomerase